MPRTGLTFAKFFTAAIFIVLEVAAVSLLRNSSQLEDIWFNRCTHRVLAATWGGGERIRNYFLLEKQNEALAAENLRLISELQRRNEMLDALGSMKVLDSIRVSGKFLFTPAKVVTMSTNTQHNYIIIDKGRLDGITEHSGIITEKGVVGLVHIVDDHFSYGVTLMNDRLGISARIGRAGIVAPLCWDGRRTDGAVLKDVPLHHEICPGDTVFTSGYSTLYPSDIPMGVIEGSRRVDGSSNLIHVRLFEDFSSLRYVVVVRNGDGKEIQSLKNR